MRPCSSPPPCNVAIPSSPILQFHSESCPQVRAKIVPLSSILDPIITSLLTQCLFRHIELTSLPPQSIIQQQYNVESNRVLFNRLTTPQPPLHPVTLTHLSRPDSPTTSTTASALYRSHPTSSPHLSRPPNPQLASGRQLNRIQHIQPPRPNRANQVRTPCHPTPL